MSNSTIHLSANLSHLCWAIEQNKDPQQILIPGLRGNHFYSHGFYKYFLKTIYFICRKVFKKRVLEHKFRSALMKTQRLFLEELEKINKHLTFYEEYRKKISVGEVLTIAQHNEFEKACLSLTSWNHWVLPFIKDAETVQTINDLFIRHLRNGQDITISPGIFYEFKNLNKVWRYEKSFGKTFPMEEVKMEEGLINNSNHAIFDKYRKKLDRWGRRMQGQEPSAVQIFHKGLKSLTHISFTNNDAGELTDVDTLGLAYNIEILLRKMGCRLFEQIDPKQVRYIASVIKAKQIVNENGVIKLGREIVLDTPLVRAFEIVDSAQEILLMGCNRAILGMNSYQMTYEKCPAPASIATKSLDIKGRYAIVEKWNKKLSEHQWGEDFEPNQQDEKVIALIVQMLGTQKRENFTPRNLDPRALVLDEQLTSMKTFVIATKDAVYDESIVRNFIYRALPSEGLRVRVRQAVGIKEL